MAIIWDNDKNDWLKLNRSISFEEISERILNHEYEEIVENPTRSVQQYFVMYINNYTWLIPFLIDEKDNIVLKTAFPSRKYHKKYGDKR
jgi:hypothetical protein